MSTQPFRRSVARVSTAWDAERVASWLRRAEALERQLAPVSAVLFEAAALQPGERVLDVGCGTGPTTREAALAVGDAGRVTGIDLSTDMIEVARNASAPSIDWIAADVATWEPPAASWDVVLSRFGVMFFDDPPSAFAALARATAPGGRLAVATWSRRTACPLFEVPLQAALSVLRDVTPPPPDAGPFSLHDPDAIARLLEEAGWSTASTVTHDLDLIVEDDAAGFLDVGPTRIVTQGVDEAARAKVVAAIDDALRDHVDADERVVLRGRVLVTTASR